MDVLQLLTADHNRVRGLFSRFETAEESDDTAAMNLIADRIFQELDVHTTVEEEVFYPAVRGQSEEVKDLVAEGFEEHHVAKTLIAEAQAVSRDSDEWKAKMKVLIESVEHHAEEEETEMFPKLRRVGLDLQGIGQQVEDRKKQLGAAVLADKIDLTKAELEQRAREQEIPGRSSMSHEELAAAVSLD